MTDDKIAEKLEKARAAKAAKKENTTEDVVESSTIPEVITPVQDNSELEAARAELKEIYTTILQDVYTPEEVATMSLKELKIAKETANRLKVTETKSKGVPRVPPQVTEFNNKMTKKVYDGLTGKYVDKNREYT